MLPITRPHILQQDTAPSSASPCEPMGAFDSKHSNYHLHAHRAVETTKYPALFHCSIFPRDRVSYRVYSSQQVSMIPILVSPLRAQVFHG